MRFIEGEWDRAASGMTLRPVLELVHHSVGIPYSHSSARTAASLEQRLRAWKTNGRRRYPILCLGYHGGPGFIDIGRNVVVQLDRLAEFFGGRIENCAIHFGSCETLAVEDDYIDEFLRRSGALAACGFDTAVDWIKAAAFELILLSHLVSREMSGRGMNGVEEAICRSAGSLAEDLVSRV